MADGEKQQGTPQKSHTQQVSDDLYIGNLFDDSDIFTTGHSFQSLVQTMSNEDQNTTPTQFNMPTELQHLFDNDTDDVLSQHPSHNNSIDFPSGQETADFIAMWKDNPQDLPINHTNNSKQSSLGIHQQQQQQQQQQPLFSIPKQALPFDSQLSTTPLQQQRNNDQRQYPQQQQQQSVSTNQQVERTASPSSSAGTMTLLDSITAQLPIERKTKFNQLFVELQKNTISAEHFLAQAKYLLDERGYQMLENLKSQTPQGGDDAHQQISNVATPSRPTHPSTSSTPPLAIPDQQQKRPLSSPHDRHEDSQRLSPGSTNTFQMKRPKLDPRGLPKASSTHINIATPPLPNPSIATPLSSSSLTSQAAAPLEPKPFAAPASTTTTQNLQIPQSTTSAPSAPSSSIKQSTTSSGTSSGGGGGDNRIDYDAITDVMGYAGVDLKEEAEHFMKDGGDSTGMLSADGIDRSKTQDFMNGRLLQQVVDKLAKPLTIAHVDPDVVAYLSLATQDRLRGLVEDMVKASKHRIKRRSPFQRPPQASPNPAATENGYPLYKVLVKANPKQALMALEKLDRGQQSPPSSPASQPKKLKQTSWTLTNKPPGYSTTTKSYSVNDTIEELEQDRLVTVVDAIFALEREGQGGKGSGQKTLLKMYNQWLE